MGVRYSAPLYVFALLAGMALMCASLYAVGVYWAYFRMGSGGGPAIFLAYVALPIGLALVVTITMTVLAQGSRRGARSRDAVRRSVFIVGIVCFAVVVLEMSRTGTDRGPESGGTWSGYLRALAHL